MTDTALAPLPVVDVDALLALPVGDERVDALAAAYKGWRRIDARVAWAFGCGLDTIRPSYSKGDWGAILDRIGIDPRKARRYLQIARGLDSGQIDRYATVDAALEAVKAKRVGPPEPAPAPAPTVEEHPVEQVVVEQVVVEQEHPEDVIEAVAVEAEPTAADLRDERLERLSVRTEDIDGPVVDGWAEKFDRQAAREREHVAANRAADKRERAWKRERADMCDDALGLPPSPEAAAFLAKYWNVARPAA